MVALKKSKHDKSFNSYLITSNTFYSYILVYLFLYCKTVEITTKKQSKFDKKYKFKCLGLKDST